MYARVGEAAVNNLSEGEAAVNNAGAGRGVRMLLLARLINRQHVVFDE